jgi:hypothetical protein
MTQPAISRHLKVLEDAGLIVHRVDGTRPKLTSREHFRSKRSTSASDSADALDLHVPTAQCPEQSPLLDPLGVLGIRQAHQAAAEPV